MSELIEKAHTYAAYIHADQTYHRAAYIHHLLHAKEIAERFGLSETIKAACLLHDTLEDTQTTYEYLKIEFGEEIAEIVYCVTDELGRNRKERKAKTYPKIAANESAILVKLCDRIANIEYSKEHGSSELQMYLKENSEFTRALYPHSPNLPIWKYYFQLIGEIESK